MKTTPLWRTGPTLVEGVWTAEREAALQRHWIANKSQAECAALLGPGFNADMVAGKIGRMRREGRWIERTPAPVILKAPPRLPPCSKVAAPGPVYVPAPAPAAPPDVPSRRLRLHQLDATFCQCRWPSHVDGEWLFCGQPVPEGARLKFCARHAAAAIQPRQETTT